MKLFLLLVEWLEDCQSINKFLKHWNHDFVTAVNEQAINAVLLLYSMLALKTIQNHDPS